MPVRDQVPRLPKARPTTTVKTPDGHEATTEEEGGPPPPPPPAPHCFTKPWVNVGVKTGLTKNLGNYESRPDSGVSDRHFPAQHRWRSTRSTPGRRQWGR